MTDRKTAIAAIQGVLRDTVAPALTVDGIAGPKTQGAWNDLIAPNETVYVGKASSFADPRDVARFRLCKMAGKSDEECFKVGDNGIGYWGDDTTGITPACALTKEDIARRWGTVDAGRNKLVQVDANGTRVICVLKDIKGNMNEAIIDLNPGACKALGIAIPAMADCTWKWVS